MNALRHPHEMSHDAALDLARAAAAVVCAPLALARLFPRPGLTVEAFHGLDEATEEQGVRDAVWAFAELADVYQMESEFEAKVAQEFERVLTDAAPVVESVS